MARLPILLVEDHASVRETTADVLREGGYDVAEVEDAFAALAFLRENDVSAVILDVYMPGMDGLVLLDHLDDPPPIALLTGHEYDKEVMARRAKVLLYLQKPVSPEDLLKAAERLVRSPDEFSNTPRDEASSVHQMFDDA